jgi:peroxiredoxin
MRRVVTCLLLVLCLFASSFAKTPRPAVNVAILAPDGKKIDLRSYRGHTILLIIFSTGCETCVRMLDMMNNIEKQLGPRGLQVIGAAGDPNAKFLLGPFVQRYRPIFPVGFIEKDAIIKVADVPQGTRPVVPILIFIDRWGMVREQYYGDSPVAKSGEPALKALAQAVIGITPVPGSGQAPAK